MTLFIATVQHNNINKQFKVSLFNKNHKTEVKQSICMYMQFDIHCPRHIGRYIKNYMVALFDFFYM